MKNNPIVKKRYISHKGISNTFGYSFIQQKERESRCSLYKESSPTQEIPILPWSAEALCVPVQKIFPQDHHWYYGGRKGWDSGITGRFRKTQVDSEKHSRFRNTLVDSEISR